MGYLPWSYILSPYRFPGHKIFGVLYLIGEIATLYGMFVKREAFESQPLWFLSMYLAGVLTTNGAIRNFRHLAKTNVNPGMFAKDRTFSMGFIVENLWFQVALLIKMVFLNPNWWGAAGLIKVPLQVFILGFDMYWTAIRKAVFPVTSYTTWEQGNDKLNDGKVSEKQINWINVQVTVTRLNYVLKSKCVIPYFLFASQAGLVPPEWRWVAYFMVFDSSHNVTTAFFLQTLKFHGHISPTLFSFLFNFTPYVGGLVCLYYFAFAGLTLTHLAYLSCSVLNLLATTQWIYPRRPYWELGSTLVPIATLLFPLAYSMGWQLVLAAYITQKAMYYFLVSPFYIWVQHTLLRKESYFVVLQQHYIDVWNGTPPTAEYFEKYPKI